MPPITPPQDGFLFLDHAKFAESFAADVEPGLAAFMGDSQVPWDSTHSTVRSPTHRGSPSRAGT